jgi:thiol-disulfide isomerase/thioredoxin
MISTIENKDALLKLLTENTGIIVLKFGAEWCGPCKKIEGLVGDWFKKMPTNVQTGVIDIDDNFELYAFLKKKRMIQGIPAIFRYNSGNTNYIPDDIVSGADKTQIDAFFDRMM